MQSTYMKVYVFMGFMTQNVVDELYIRDAAKSARWTYR
jgi:hypothetical protein